MNQFETDRLRLRMFREDDLVPYREMCSHPEVCRWVGDGNPLDRIATWRHLAGIPGHWQLRGYGLWAVEEKDRNTRLGSERSA